MARIDDFRCIWVGNLSSKVDKELLYELFLQAGPVGDIALPKDTYGRPASYGFVTFKHQCSVSYAVQLFDRTALFGKELKIRAKQRTMPEQTNDSSLRGYNASICIQGRNDLIDSNFHNSSDSMMPRVNAYVAGNNKEQFVPNGPDFNMLLQMGQQLLQNPYGSLMGGSFGPVNSSGYPSQMMNPMMCPMNRHGDDGNRHNQNDHRSRGRYDRDYHDYDKVHPYRDNRRDDRRHGHGHHNNSRYHQSSSHHRRERK